MSLSEPTTHWCDRCKASVPSAEWKLHWNGGRLYFRHEGPMRGVLYADPPSEALVPCGQVDHVPGV